ncbi:MAG: hypothetical protein AABX52_00670 [Nanoarchaeota archaeon]
MNLLQTFVKAFDVTLSFSIANIKKISAHYFFAQEPQCVISEKIKQDLFAIGLPLGMIKKRIFVPSFVFLDMIAISTKHKAIVNEKAEWLFICGRDVFKEGVLECHSKPGELVIVLNTRKECLGYGRVVHRNKVFIENILDRGDFLRRER